MAKVTSKLQVTIPKAVAERYGIRPGDHIEWVPAGDAIRVLPPGPRPALDLDARLELFDRATERQLRRRSRRILKSVPPERGWKREDLYIRGGSD